MTKEEIKSVLNECDQLLSGIKIDDCLDDGRDMQDVSANKRFCGASKSVAQIRDMLSDIILPQGTEYTDKVWHECHEHYHSNLPETAAVTCGLLINRYRQEMGL